MVSGIKETNRYNLIQYGVLIFHGESNFMLRL